MSSRNVRLSVGERENSSVIYKTLKYVYKKFKTASAKECEEYAMARFKKNGFKPEYFEIVDGNLLTSVDSYKDSSYIVACTAVWIGDVRLIDNKILKKVLD